MPIHAVTVDGNIYDKVLDKSSQNAFGIIDELEEQYPDDWIERINSIIRDIETNIFSKAMEVAVTIGYDTCGVGYIPFMFESKENMTDIFGRKYKIIK